MKLLKNASRVAILCFFLLCVNGCKEEKDDSPLPYNPNLPVTISDFTPHNGGAKTRMIIYGSNFGTDPSIISLKIGGKEAKVINSRGDCLYCITPPMSYEGTIELQIGDGEVVVAPTKFQYNKVMTVSTLCGNIDELGKWNSFEEGSFDDKDYGINTPTWLSFDPKDHNILYCLQDIGANSSILKLNLKDRYISTVLRTGANGVNRFRAMTWTTDGDTMLVVTTKNSLQDPAVVYSTRNGADQVNFNKSNTGYQPLVYGQSCNAVAVHPINHELYYHQFKYGAIYRYDYWKYGFGTLDKLIEDPEFSDNKYVANATRLCALGNQWNMNLIQHPTGDYMYLLINEKHMIMRCNYDWENKTYTAPYIVCGMENTPGYKDLVGSQARLNGPFQGVFVKNPEYTGKTDEYDFYFTDRYNHCIRILSPDGVVTTFAGRGSTALDSNAKGYIDGDLRQEARFNEPQGLAYDEETQTFYIGDWNNHRIRKISYEYTDDVDEPILPEEGDENEGEDVGENEE